MVRYAVQPDRISWLATQRDIILHILRRAVILGHYTGGFVVVVVAACRFRVVQHWMLLLDNGFWGMLDVKYENESFVQPRSPSHCSCCGR